MTLIYFTEKRVDSDEFIRRSYAAYCRVFGVKEENFDIDRTGKPRFLKDGKEAGVFFSLSHSGSYTACAVGDENVGFDLQIHKEADFSLLSKRLFGEEIADMTAFYERFSVGEARVKYNGGNFFAGMREGDGVVLKAFNGYSAALCGGGTPFLLEEYEQD